MTSQQHQKFFDKFGRSAFSLVELAVVILVIGVLAVGTSQGYSLVKSAQLSNARAMTSKSPIGQIPDLLAWYESSLKESFNSAQIREGAQISEWKDISPSSLLNGNNKLTVTASNNITFSSNATNRLPAIKFNGSSRLNLVNFAQGSFSQATIFIVFSPNVATDTTNYKTLLDGNTNNFSVSFKQNAVQLNAGTAGTTTAVANSFILQRSYILCTYFNTTKSQVFSNNTASSLGGNIFNIGTNSLDGLNIGASRTGTLGYSGTISEIAIFNRVLKAGERKEIFNYLAKKYRIEVSGI